MIIRPVYTAEAQAQLAEAARLGTPKPRVKPLYWQLRGRLGGRKGVQVNRRFDSRRAAEDAWRELVADWEATKSRGVDPAKLAQASQMTLREFITAFYIPNHLARLAPNTKKHAQRFLDQVILPTLGDHRLCDITALVVDGWVTELETLEFPVWSPRDSNAVGRWRRGEGEMPTPIGWAPKKKPQQVHAISWLKSVLAYAYSTNTIRTDPAKHIVIGRKHFERGRKKKRGRDNNDKPVEPWKIERVRLEMNGRDRAILRVLYVEGNRPHELAAWVWGDIRDPDSGAIYDEIEIDAGISDDELWDTKTYRSRRNKLFEPAREALQEWLEERTDQLRRAPEDDELVFPNLSPRATRTHMNVHNWGSIILRAACKRAGIVYFNQYRLRATCAALLGAGGDEQPDGSIKPWSIAEVAEHLGHSSQTCEEHYFGFFNDRGKYRRVPIEQAVRDAVNEANEMHEAWVGELREMAEVLTYSEIAERLNAGTILPPRQGRWTKASARELLIRKGIHELVSADRRETNARTLARLKELASSQTPKQIAATLNDEGHPLLLSQQGRWSREYVVGILTRAGITPTVLNPHYEAAVARLLELVGVGSHQEIAEILNREGHRQKHGEMWMAQRVGKTLCRHGIRSTGERNRSFEAACARLTELAHETGLSSPALAARMNEEGHRGKWGAPWTAGMVGDVLRGAGIGGNWTRNPRYAEALAELRKLADTGMTDTAIADTLNDAGHQTSWSKRWTPNAVYTALRRDRSRGRRAA